MKNVATTGKRVGYGWLYNWYAILNPIGLAPDGWTITTNDNWLELFDHVGGIDVAGGKLKSTLNEWESPNSGATDEYKLNILPSGTRSTSGSFANMRISTQMTAIYTPGYASAITRRFRYDREDTEGLWHGIYNFGYPVRCIQNKLTGESNGVTGILTDIDGNIYKWVVIGNYRWMAENLRTTKYKNGTAIPEITDNTDWGNDTTGARCAYDNDHYYVYPPGR